MPKHPPVRSHQLSADGLNQLKQKLGLQRVNVAISDAQKCTHWCTHWMVDFSDAHTEGSIFTLWTKFFTHPISVSSMGVVLVAMMEVQTLSPLIWCFRAEIKSMPSRAVPLSTTKNVAAADALERRACACRHPSTGMHSVFPSRMVWLNLYSFFCVLRRRFWLYCKAGCFL